MAELPTPSRALRADFNGDGQYTVADLVPWLEQAFFLPGDWLIWMLAAYSPPVAEFLELGVADYGGVLSGFLSALAWLGLIVVVAMSYAAVRDIDRALTQGAGRIYAEARRRGRVAAILLALRLRRERQEPATEDAVELVEETELSPTELRVLRLHAELRPGYALAVGEVAAALGVRRDQAQQVLQALERLTLLHGTLGGLDGENAYTLTSAGRAFLVLRQLSSNRS
jgi:hypothetical protein